MASGMDISLDQRPTTRRRRNSIEKPPSFGVEESLRILIFGVSGHQSSLTQSILQTPKDVHATTTTKTTGKVTGRNVTLVNTPNLNDHDLSHDILKKEFKKSICFTCPGPHAILFTLNPLDVPANAYEIFKPVVQYFGKHILKHTMIVLYHEGELSSQSLLDSVMNNRDIRELKEKCEQQFFIFDGKQSREDGSMVKDLFLEIDKIVVEHGIFSNPEFIDADNRIKKEVKFLEKQSAKEVREMLKALQDKYSGGDLANEILLYTEKVQLENRKKAELLTAKRLGFTLRLVDYAAAIGKGAFVGALLGLAMGYEATALGAAVGAALGGIFGGAFKAVSALIASSFEDVQRDTAPKTWYMCIGLACLALLCTCVCVYAPCEGSAFHPHCDPTLEQAVLYNGWIFHTCLFT